MYYSYYTPILILQGFCLYHAYQKGTQQKWFYFIIFLPLVGCLIYLYANFFGDLKKGAQQASQGMKGLFNSNYEIDQLEKEISFSDTVENKIRLGDAYLAKGRYQEALELFQSCEKGVYKEDVELLMKLLRAHYLNDNFAEAVSYGERLKDAPEFAKAAEKIGLAWAYYYEKQVESAKATFEEMDLPFSNYKNRLEYCKFLLEIEQPTAAKEKLALLMDEINHMSPAERKFVGGLQQEIKALYQSVK